MITAILVDDEKNALEVLQMQLEQYCKEVQIIASCNSGEEGVKAILSLQPELVFLDIEMPHINGFEVLNQTKEEHFQVVFTTAYDQFAIKAFKFSAIDYLLKPIDILELQASVKKVTKSKEQLVSKSSILNLLTQFNTEKKSSKIVLPIGNSLEFFEPNDIVRFESDSNYTHVFLANKKKITLCKTLKEVEENIQGEPFFRVHQSHLINTNFIDKIIKAETPYIVLKDATTINISRHKKEAFFDFFRKL